MTERAGEIIITRVIGEPKTGPRMRSDRRYGTGVAAQFKEEGLDRITFFREVFPKTSTGIPLPLYEFRVRRAEQAAARSLRRHNIPKENITTDDCR